MSKYLERAKVLRATVEPHYNCGQAVLLPFAEELGIPADLAMRFAANFGRGMKGGELCGAIAGGLAALGLLGLDSPDITAAYYQHWRAHHPEGVDCTTLLRLCQERGEVRKAHCDALVFEAVQLVEELSALQTK